MYVYLRTQEAYIPQLDGSYSQNRKKRVKLSRKRHYEVEIETDQQPKLELEPPHSELILEPPQSGLIPEPLKSGLIPEPPHSGLIPEPSHSLLGVQLRENTPDLRKRKRSRSITDDRCSSEYSDTTLLSTPPSVLATRALNSSLFPKVPKLSREDSEKYLTALKEQRQTKPSKKTKLETQYSSPDSNSSSKTSTEYSNAPLTIFSSEFLSKPYTKKSNATCKPITSKSTMSKLTASKPTTKKPTTSKPTATHTRTSKNLRTRPFVSYDVSKINKAENDMISQAIAESLKTLQMEKKSIQDQSDDDDDETSVDSEVDVMEQSNSEASHSVFIEEPYSSDDDSIIKHRDSNSDDTSSEFQLILSSESELDEPQTCTSPTVDSPSPSDFIKSATVSWRPGLGADKCILQPQLDPPLLQDTLHSVRHCKPFYSNPLDKQPPQ